MTENKCIYYPDRNNLLFETEEHVFPAGLGGIMKLLKGYVSNEFNNDISEVELRFMRESIIALPRQILGPGKRGKNAVKYATKSSIHLIEDITKPGKFSAGYIQLAKPFEIPQVKLNQETGHLECSIPQKDIEENAKEILLNHLKEFKVEKLRYVSDNRLTQNELIIGFDKLTYVFKSSDNFTEVSKSFIDVLIHAIENIIYYVPSHQRYQTKTHQKVVLGDDYYRICAKTAFNILAKLLGKRLVLEQQFDEIRNYIVKGENKNLVVFQRALGKIDLFPEDSHHVILRSSNSKLFANVSFYNHFECQVLLSSNFKGELVADGYVCDWKNRKEHRLDEYLGSIIFPK